MKKAPILTDEQMLKVLWQVFGGHGNVVPPLTEMTLTSDDIGIANKVIAQTQCDADHEYYQGVVKEIFEEIENGWEIIKEEYYPPYFRYNYNKWQVLKSRFLEKGTKKPSSDAG